MGTSAQALRNQISRVDEAPLHAHHNSISGEYVEAIYYLTRHLHGHLEQSSLVELLAQSILYLNSVIDL